MAVVSIFQKYAFLRVFRFCDVGLLLVDSLGMAAPNDATSDDSSGHFSGNFAGAIDFLCPLDFRGVGLELATADVTVSGDFSTSRFRDFADPLDLFFIRFDRHLYN